MADKPILFSAPMIRAILKGSKSMTRRALKPAPTGCKSIFKDKRGIWMVEIDGTMDLVKFVPPKINVGDTLWVREAWQSVCGYDDRPPRNIPEGTPVHYAADATANAGWKWGRRRPSMFTPRWASRITLRVTAVKVERLQDISEANAIAEGVLPVENGFHWLPDQPNAPWATLRYKTAIGAFNGLWESINGEGSWDANPWVAAYSFERVT